MFHAIFPWKRVKQQVSFPTLFLSYGCEQENVLLMERQKGGSVSVTENRSESYEIGCS